MISLGLIVNELVTNSIKHAFKECNNGKIGISLKLQKGNELCLTISDNGNGIPHKIDFRNTRSLGLQLVCSLTKQINGEVTYINTKGSTFKINFPNNINSIES